MTGTHTSTGPSLSAETKPWKMQLTKTPPNFGTLTESEIAECYLVVEYTLG